MNTPTQPGLAAIPAADKDLYAEAIDRILERIERTAVQIGDAFPLSADPDTGQWLTAPDGRWTGGFWAGQLWLAHRASGAARFRDLALAAMRRLEVRLPIDNVLNGLVFHYGAAAGAILGNGDAPVTLARKAADALAGRFNARAGFIPLGHQSGSLTGDPAGETNIDGVPGMSLLYWAAANGGGEQLADAASRHMRRHIELCQRSDGSLHQAALVDSHTGATLKQFSPRGLAPDGTWARAQSWGLVGFAQAYLWTREDDFLDAARRVADWWLAHAPADRVAFWDFTDPKVPQTFRDTSATAMIAAGLLKLAMVPGLERYRAEAAALVRALVEGYLAPVRPGDPRARGMLTEGCWQRNEGVATKHELVWGDYYLLEALLVLDGRVGEIL
jgi:unsaturated chondroitin disaccharide hydrolase